MKKICFIFALFALNISAPAWASDPPEAKLSFTPDQAIEIAFTSIVEGKESQLFQEYFPAVMPIVLEYGGQFVASFRVISGTLENVQPQAMTLLTWPNVEAYEKITSDPRVGSLIPIRNEALAYINEANFFDVKTASSLVLDPMKTYRLSFLDQPVSDDPSSMVLNALSSSLGEMKARSVLIEEVASDQLGSEGRIIVRFNPPSQ